MRAGADKGAWSGNLCRASASGAGRGGRGFSFPSTCIDTDTDISFSFSLSLPISISDTDPRRGRQSVAAACGSIRLLAPPRTVVGFVAAVAVLVLVAVKASAGFAIGAGAPPVLSRASSAAHLARTRAAMSSAALTLRLRGNIKLPVLWRDSADDVALLRLLPGRTVA